MTLSSDSLARMKNESGVGRFTLAFIVSGRPCKASWGGFYGIDDPAMNRRIARLKEVGGHAIISFGGAAGQELANTCTTVTSLAAQYQAVINPSLDYDGRMGDYAIQAARATHRQLTRIYPDRSDAALWRMVGVTPMIGINDDNKEIFTSENARQLTTFAKQRRLGRLAMWSANRDRPCPTPTSWASNDCSGVGAPEWAFSRIFDTFGP